MSAARGVPPGPSGGGDHAELQEVARASVIGVIGTAAGAVLGFVLVVVIARGLHAGGAGVFFEAVAVFTILANVLELGADTGLVRMLSRSLALGRAADVRTTVAVALWPVLALGTVVGVALFALAPDLARVLTGPEHRAQLVTYLRVFAPTLPLQAASVVALAGGRGLGTVMPLVVVERIAKPAARLVLAMVAVGAGLGAFALSQAWALPVWVGFVASLAWLALLLKGIGPGEGRAAPWRSLASAFWRFSIPRAFSGMFEITIVWLDVLLVGVFLSSTQTGVYAAASRLVTAGTLALQAVRFGLAPEVSALLARGDRARAEDLHQTMTWWLVAASWPVYLTLATFAPLVLRTFGLDFTTGQSALVILSLAMMVNLGTGNVQVVLLMGGRSAWQLFNVGVALALNIALNLILIPRLGISGAAIAWAASIIFDNVATIVEVRFLLGIRSFGSGYPVVAVGAAVCFGLLGVSLRVALGPTVPALLILLTVGTAAYAWMLWRFRGPLRGAILWSAIRGRADKQWRGPGVTEGRTAAPKVGA